MTDNPPAGTWGTGYTSAADALAELATLRQSLTEAEASHQAEIGRLRGLLSACDLGKEVLRERIRSAETERDLYRNAIQDILDRNLLAGCGAAGKKLRDIMGAKP